MTLKKGKTLKIAKANRMSETAKLEKYEKLVSTLWYLIRKNPEFSHFTTSTEYGIKLTNLLRGTETYTWHRVGKAKYMYPFRADSRKVEPVAYIVEDVDFIKRNLKDVRFTWRVLGRAGTDENGWCRTETAAMERCEEYFTVKENT